MNVSLPENHSFMARLRDGDRAAVATVWRCLQPALKQRAERCLFDATKQFAAADDVVQSVFRTLMSHLDNHDFSWLETPSDVRRLLFGICANKAFKKNRHEKIRAHGAGANGRPTPVDLAAATDLTPDQAAELEEACGRLVDLLDADLQPIALLTLSGVKPKDIAPLLRLSRRTVERACSEFESIWRELENEA